MATAIAQVATQQVTLPPGEVEEQFLFSLSQGGTVLSQVFTPGLSASFPQVPPGDYNIKVVKNGYSADADFVVPNDGTVAVPVTLSVTIEA